MTDAHELARQLLALPREIRELPLMAYDFYGNLKPVTGVVESTPVRVHPESGVGRIHILTVSTDPSLRGEA